MAKDNKTPQTLFQFHLEIFEPLIYSLERFFLLSLNPPPKMCLQSSRKEENLFPVAILLLNT